ncbi:hypothetical protein NQ318_002056 [Aromia moschata]|uniref:Uncharacterized protein n=1 Tax=Aromia moschata TaxID=1265417 RepID=A0AAV8Z306_9CUCU|nr:hypothetical protein NQ318_002056 [Aromia moschata]
MSLTSGTDLGLSMLCGGLLPKELKFERLSSCSATLLAFDSLAGEKVPLTWFLSNLFSFSITISAVQFGVGFRGLAADLNSEVSFGHAVSRFRSRSTAKYLRFDLSMLWNLKRNFLNIK